MSSDLDSDGDVITYSCAWDATNNGSLDTSNACNLSGFSFDISTGVLSGTPNVFGIFEFHVTGTSSGGSDTKIFVVTVNDIPDHAGEWVKIPADMGGAGLPAFWVMKYEAKAWNDADADSIVDAGEVDSDGVSVALGSNVPVSVEGDVPWRSISGIDSEAECASLGAGYALITNAEWMAISRDAEVQDANWTSGTVGTGCMTRGNSGDTTCGYNGADPEGGPGRNTRAKYTLSSGDEIFDLAGNVWEWIDWDDPTNPTAGYQDGPDTTSCPGGDIENTDILSSCGPVLATSEFDSTTGTLEKADGIGCFYGDPGTGGGVRRGGHYSRTDCSGVYYLTFYSPSTYTSVTGGFRCVYRPTNP